MNNHQYPTIVYSRQDFLDKKLLNNFLVDNNIKFTPTGNVYKDYQAYVRINNIEKRQKYAFKAHFPAEHLRPIKTPSPDAKKRRKSASPTKKTKKSPQSSSKYASLKASQKDINNISTNLDLLNANNKSQIKEENKGIISSRTSNEGRSKSPQKEVYQGIAPQEQERNILDAAVESIQKEIILFLQKTDPNARDSPNHSIQNQIRELCIKNLQNFNLDPDQALVVINRVMKSFGISSGSNHNSNFNSTSSRKEKLQNSGRLSEEKWGETTFGSIAEKDRILKQRSSAHSSSANSLRNPINSEVTPGMDEYMYEQKPTPRLGALNSETKNLSSQKGSRNMSNERDYSAENRKLKEYLDDQFKLEDDNDPRNESLLNRSHRSMRSSKSNKSLRGVENHEGRASTNSGGRNSKNQNTNIKIMDESYQSYRNEDYESGDQHFAGNIYHLNGNYPSYNSHSPSYNSDGRVSNKGLYYGKSVLNKSRGQVSLGGTPLSSNISGHSSLKQFQEIEEESWDYRSCKSRGTQKSPLRIQNIVKKEVKVITAAELNAAIELRQQKEEEMNSQKKSVSRSPRQPKKEQIIQEYQRFVKKGKSKSKSKSPQKKTLMVQDILHIPSKSNEDLKNSRNNKIKEGQDPATRLLSESEILINTTPKELADLRVPRYHSPKKVEIRRKLGDYDKFYKERIEGLNNSFIDKVTSTLKEFVRSNEKSWSPITNRGFVFKYDPIEVEQAKFNQKKFIEELYNEYSRKLLQKQIDHVDKKQTKLLRNKSRESSPVDYKRLSSSDIMAYHKTLLLKSQLQSIDNFRKTSMSGILKVEKAKE